VHRITGYRVLNLKRLLSTDLIIAGGGGTLQPAISKAQSARHYQRRSGGKIKTTAAQIVHVRRHRKTGASEAFPRRQRLGSRPELSIQR
jgi:hypothetical protein